MVRRSPFAQGLVKRFRRGAISRVDPGPRSGMTIHEKIRYSGKHSYGLDQIVVHHWIIGMSPPRSTSEVSVRSDDVP